MKYYNSKGFLKDTLKSKEYQISKVSRDKDWSKNYETQTQVGILNGVQEQKDTNRKWINPHDFFYTF